MMNKNLLNNKTVLGLIFVLVALGSMLLIPSTRNRNNQPGSQSENLETQTAQKSEEQKLRDKQFNQVTVIVTKSGFSPSTVTIKTGQKVVWTNKSGGLASVHAADHPTHLVYPPLNLGEFSSDSSVQLTFDRQGTFKYHDHLKPEHQGTIIVK